MTMEVSAGKNELTDYMRALIEFLRESAKSFDKGCDGEARRMAACIKALVYDSKQTKSVLGRLGLTGMFFYDYSPDYNPKIDLPFSGLAIVTLGGKTMRYVPRLSQDDRIKVKTVSLKEWLEKPVIVDTSKNTRITRESIVLSVANANIGIINQELTGAYERLTLKPYDESIMAPIGDLIQIEYASVRHIAFELILSMEDQFPEYLHTIH